VISILIKIDSRGPVFFTQTRLGQNGKPFKCLKFRSMYLDGDDLLAKYLDENPEEISFYEKYHKYQKDPRITPIGRILRKLSIDELPQLINVLRGEMSLIGPRPYMISEQKKLESNDNTILLVKPGITGLWQVSGRNALDFQARINLDKWYIQNWSLWLDLIILIKTIKVVLLGRDAR
jgi:undecaprenyl-phosphate galactose phosphotransferase